MSNSTTNTTTPTPAQHAVLTHAIEHTNGKIEWFPANIKGGARQKVLNGLFSRALVTTDGGEWIVSAQGYDALGLPQPEANKWGNQFVANLDQIIANAEATQDATNKPEVAAADTSTEVGCNERRTRSGSKQAEVIRMLQRREGATIDQLCLATGWQAHSVRGVLAGTLKKKMGLNIVSDKQPGGERVYRVADSVRGPKGELEPLNALLTVIAQKHLGIETLETRHTDRLDFHDTAVWCLRDALAAAFNAGREQGLMAKVPAQNVEPFIDTQNEESGFFGTMKERAKEAWPLAMLTIANATRKPLESVRPFLDSCWGIRYAEAVRNSLTHGQALRDAIIAVTEAWMDRRMDSISTWNHGLPSGVSYLKGLVIHCDAAEQDRQSVPMPDASPEIDPENASPLNPAPANKEWGFYGAMGVDADAAWPLAVAAISDATHQPPRSAQTFLDSGHGRHFADEVNNGLHQGWTLQAAISATTQHLMDRRVGQKAARRYGIPADLPWLTGFVIHCEVG